MPPGHPPEARETILMARALLRHAKKQGIDPSLFAPYDMMMADDLATPGTSIPLHSMDRIADTMARLLGDEHCCLHLSEYPAPHDYGLAGYYVAAAEDNETMLKEAFGLVREISNIFDIRVEFTPSMGRFILEPRFGCEPSRYMAEMDLAAFLRGMQALTGPSFEPWELRLAHGRGYDAAVYRDLFQCKVSFNQSAYEMRFDPRLREQPPSTSDPKLRAALAPLVPGEMSALLRSRTLSLTARVQAQIQKRLCGSVPKLEEIADALKTNPRSLQHGLTRQGVTFRQLLDQARKLTAIGAIIQGTSPTRIAQDLGYHEPASFYRAFRRWTGSTPMALRATYTQGPYREKR